MKCWLWRLALTLLLLLPGAGAGAQDDDETVNGISLTVQAGFATYFRDSEWLPVTVQLRNDGDALSGRLVIRPETSAGVLNTTSTPVSLAAGARQIVTLYISARASTGQVRVELLQDDRVIAQQSAPLRAISTFDPLYLVITESAVGTTDLTGADTGEAVYQANMALADLPDRLAILDAVDAILIADADTSSLSSGQVRTLADWVASGGHLIVAGGVNWQATAATLSGLLPLVPNDSRSVSGLRGLADWLRADDLASAAAVIATGTLAPEAEALVSLEDGGEALPLISRRGYGDGVVDYLAVDPNSAPLRGWANVGALWTTLLTTVEPLPGWGSGFIGWEAAAVAAEILPGFDPLPDVLPLFGFLALYIALVGPLNYFILSRLNRREWAWVTIPVLILVFSALAYTLGANLRGNEVTLSRLAVVRSWQDADRARVDALLGLLSPKRAAYTFAVEAGDLEGVTFRPIPRPPLTTSLLTRSVQANIDIVQTDDFEAEDFNVDASFVGGFNAAGSIPKPAISGSAVFAYDPSIAGQQIVRGSLRNDSDLTLTEPVLLVRGVALYLDASILPGGRHDFEIILPGEAISSAARRASTATSPFFSSRIAGSSGSKQTVIDILGTRQYDANIARRTLRDLSAADQELRRRQWLLTALIEDYFDATGRGDRVYLAGWADAVPLNNRLVGANWNANDRALYLIELESSVQATSGEVVIPAERFVWSPMESQMMGDVSPLSLTMQPGEIASLRFAPLPDAILSEVSELIVQVDNVNIGARDFPVQLWNWERAEWETVRMVNEVVSVRDPDAYLGPQNMIQIRLIADDIAGFLRIGRINVSMVGRL